MNSILLSVIIPTYNDWENVKLCVNSLLNQTLPRHEYEIIVVNNNPDDRCPYRFDNENTSIVSEPQKGSYAARNRGIEIARGTYLAFTDSDCQVHAKWLENALFYLKNNDLIGGNVVNYIKEDAEDKNLYLYDYYNGFPQHYYVTKRNASVTANLITKRSLFEDIGYFKNDLISGGDFEWTQRATANGYTLIYAADVIVYHPSRTIEELSKKKQRIASGEFQKNRDHKYRYLLRNILIILLYPLIYIISSSEPRKNLRFFYYSYYLQYNYFKKYIMLYFNKH